jgi:hypothetical protein
VAGYYPTAKPKPKQKTLMTKATNASKNSFCGSYKKPSKQANLKKQEAHDGVWTFQVPASAEEAAASEFVPLPQHPLISTVPLPPLHPKTFLLGMFSTDT